MRKVFQILIVIVLCVFSAEATLRVYNHFFPSYLFYSDSYKRFKGVPGQKLWGHPLNNYGFQDQAFSVEKNNSYRILAIGDSFTFGVVPQPYNWVTLLEEDLQSKGHQLEIYNMGLSGTGQRQQLAYLLNEGFSFQPDMILLSIFVGNDLLEVNQQRPWENILLFSLANSLFKMATELDPTIFRRDGNYCDTCPTIGKQAHMKTQSKRSKIFQQGHPAVEKKLIKFEKHLQAFVAACEQRGIELRVLILPDEMQVDQKIMGEVKRDWLKSGLDDNWDMFLPNQIISSTLKELNVSYLDLTPPFAERGKTKVLYKPMDTHWNIAGNRLAAELVAPFLEKDFKGLEAKK